MSIPLKIATLRPVASAALLLIAAGACHRKEIAEERPPSPVQTAAAVIQDVPLYVDTFGSLNSIHTVDVIPQVDGKLVATYFTEGALVRAGAPLFLIETNTYAAAVDKAAAQLAGDEVDLQLKQETLERNRKLIDRKLIAQQDFDTYESSVRAAQAKVQADRAALEQARINLGYCAASALVDAVAGKRLVDPGNIVEENKTKIVNLRVVDPLYVDFTVNEDFLGPIQRTLNAGQEVRVVLAPKGDSANVHTGRVTFLNNAVDEQSGTIALRATVPNPNRTLWPGQFVNIRLYYGVLHNAVVVPAGAVQAGKMGAYLFVVGAGQKAELRVVREIYRTEDEVALAAGVQGGETVVTTGQMGLYPGAPVAVVAADTNAAPAAAQP